MAIDTPEKRHAVLSMGKVWNRNTFPVASPDEQWRMSVGNVYGGNALSPSAAILVPGVELSAMNNRVHLAAQGTQIHATTPNNSLHYDSKGTD